MFYEQFGLPIWVVWSEFCWFSYRRGIVLVIYICARREEYVFHFVHFHQIKEIYARNEIIIIIIQSIFLRFKWRFGSCKVN